MKIILSEKGTKDLMRAIGINQNDSKKAKYGPQSSPQEIIAEPAKHEILTAVVT